MIRDIFLVENHIYWRQSAGICPTSKTSPCAWANLWNVLFVFSLHTSCGFLSSSLVRSIMSTFEGSLPTSISTIVLIPFLYLRLFVFNPRQLYAAERVEHVEMYLEQPPLLPLATWFATLLSDSGLFARNPFSFFSPSRNSLYNFGNFF